MPRIDDLLFELLRDPRSQAQLSENEMHPKWKKFLPDLAFVDREQVYKMSLLLRKKVRAQLIESFEQSFLLLDEGQTDGSADSNNILASFLLSKEYEDSSDLPSLKLGHTIEEAFFKYVHSTHSEWLNSQKIHEYLFRHEFLKFVTFHSFFAKAIIPSDNCWELHISHELYWLETDYPAAFVKFLYPDLANPMLSVKNVKYTYAITKKKSFFGPSYLLAF